MHDVRFSPEYLKLNARNAALMLQLGAVRRELNELRAQVTEEGPADPGTPAIATPLYLVS